MKTLRGNLRNSFDTEKIRLVFCHKMFLGRRYLCFVVVIFFEKSVRKLRRELFHR